MSIVLGSQFSLQTTLPLDDRQKVANTTARDAISAGVRWEGMLVYVVADTKTYQLLGGIANANWVEFGGGGGTAITELSGDVTAVGPGVAVATISDLPLTKLQAQTPGRVIVTDASTGVIESGGVTTTELDLLSGKTALVSPTSTDTLQNKTIDGDDNTVRDLPITAIKTNLTDASKFMVRDASGVPTSSTKDVPAGVVVGTTDSQTLTNKTLTSPVIGTITNTGTITLPTATDTLVGRATTDVLTNKDYAGGTASNTSRLTVPKAAKATLDALTRKQATLVYASDTDKLYKDNGSVLVEVGGGVGGINYVTNYDAEIDTTGWATYADAAATFPVDGTGGSPSLTFTRTTSTPLRGTASFLITKGATNRQGDGASYAFTIDEADKAKVLSISFDYAVASGTYASGDLAVFVYDVTNSSLIQPAGSGILTVGTNAKYTSTFQTNSNSASYRLIIHCASTSASAYTVKMDNVIVGPQSLQYGAATTDWVAFTPTGSWTTNTTYSGRYRRVGDTAEFEVGLSLAGAPTSANLTINTPFTIDTTKVSGSGTVGRGRLYDLGVQEYDAEVAYASSSSVSVRVLNASGTYATNAGFVTQLVPFTWGSSDALVVRFSVPISGWSSNVLMSSDTDTRVVGFSASTAAAVASLTSSFSDVKFSTVAYDSHGAYVASTGTYTVVVPGFYLVAAAVEFTGTTAANADEGIRLVASGGSFAGQYNLAPTNSAACVYSAAAGIYCAAGTPLKVQAATGRTTPSFSVAASVSNFTVTRMSGPAAIAATESVNCKYTNSAGTSIANTGSDINVPFATKVFDSHNSWNGTQFVVPVSGKYRISGNVEFASSAYSAGDQVILSAYKSGSSVSGGPRVTATAATFSAGVMVTTTVDCVAGDTLELRVANARTAGATLLRTVTLTNHIEIERIGN